MYQNQNQQGFGAQQQNIGGQQGFSTQQAGAAAQQGSQSGSSSRGNKTVVPEAKGALNQMKYEIASELGINLKQGYNGDLPSRQAGYIGGYMTKRLVEQAERAMSGHQA